MYTWLARAIIPLELLRQSLVLLTIRAGRVQEEQALHIRWMQHHHGVVAVCLSVMGEIGLSEQRKR